MQARLEVAIHQSITPRWGNIADCLSQTAQQVNLPVCSPQCPFNAEGQARKL